MRNFILSIALISAATAALAEAEIKEVCKDRLDKAGQPMKDKKGQIVQDCKKIKVHKKLEGHEVPVKK
jgi:hypothetical protein